MDETGDVVTRSEEADEPVIIAVETPPPAVVVAEAPPASQSLRVTKSLGFVGDAPLTQTRSYGGDVRRCSLQQ